MTQPNPQKLQEFKDKVHFSNHLDEEQIKDLFEVLTTDQKLEIAYKIYDDPHCVIDLIGRYNTYFTITMVGFALIRAYDRGKTDGTN